MLIDLKDARRSLEQDEFFPYFQPIVVLRTGQLAGFEALARWIHPTLGMIPPDQFIALAERDGWIGRLTQRLLYKSFTYAASIPDPLTLAINISPVQLRDLTLAKQIQEAARGTGFSLNRLVVEITESALTDNLDHAAQIAEELKSLGCRLALDDFGTGYSSLTHLQSLPFDELKVDRSFVSSMAHRRESRKIVAAVVGLGQSLGLTAVAEGVETREQAEMLLWMGCEQGQGWFYGRPTPAEELPGVVATLRGRIKNELPNHWRAALSANLDALPSQRLAQLQAVYDGAPVGLAFLDCNLQYVNLNQKLADMNGATVEAHLGSSVKEMLPAVFAQAEPFLRRALKGEAINGMEIKRKLAGEQEEKSFLVSYQPACDESGEVVGLSVALLETTQLKRAEEALRENVALLDALPVGLVVADTSGSGASVANSEAMHIFSDVPAVGTDAPAGWSATAKDEKLMEAAALPMERALHGLTTEIQEVLAERNDGSEVWVQRSGAPILDDKGEVAGGVVVIHDIDEVKREREHLNPSDEKLMEHLAAYETDYTTPDAKRTPEES